MGNFSAYVCIPELGIQLLWLTGDMMYLRPYSVGHQITRREAPNRFSAFFAFPQKVLDEGRERMQMQQGESNERKKQKKQGELTEGRKRMKLVDESGKRNKPRGGAKGKYSHKSCIS